MAVADTVDIVKAVVETAAIAVAALWAAWTFHKLQSVRAAAAEINNKLTTTREIERRLLSGQPNLDITFSEITEQYSPGAVGGSLIVSVEIRNSGLRNLELYFDKATLAVGRFQAEEVSAGRMCYVHRTGPQYLPDRGDTLEVMAYRIFRAGQRRNMVFIVPVSGSGPHLVQFQTAYHALPFEGESTKIERTLINAVEQRIVSVTGKGTVVLFAPDSPTERGPSTPQR